MTTEWHPMDTAPMNGQQILIWYDAVRGRLVTAAYWEKGTWKTPTVWVEHPGGWRPMPEPPQGNGRRLIHKPSS